MDGSAADVATSCRRVLEEQLAAVNAHDADRHAAYYAEDAVLHDPEYSGPLRGREAIRRDMRKFLTAFPDVVGELRQMLTSGRRVAVEITMTGTNTGPIGVPGGTPLPATGRRLRLPYAAFIRFDDAGRIVEERRYFDVAGIFRQLGRA
ncbi:ester cyclase [Kocuria turfanensis]|uniref:ester cyclase n=1 Tax=Kocuria turfanensis TaxID=388357 RepID=UPI004036A6A3